LAPLLGLSAIWGCGRIHYDPLPVDDACSDLVLPERGVYYSIGTATEDLAAGNPTVSIASGIASFSAAQPAKVGVGDIIAYDAGQRAIITGRCDASTYRVATVKGNEPGDVASGAVESIHRSFSSITDAQAESPGASFLESADLVAADVRLHWAVYNDGPLDEAEIVIDGWVTGPDNGIRIFAPSTRSEVGSTQRHEGRAGTGARLAPVFDASLVTTYRIVSVLVSHVRVEGLEIDASGISNAQILIGVELSAAVGSVYWLDGLILHGLSNSDRGSDGDMSGLHIDSGSARLSNSLIYAIRDFHTGAATNVSGIRVSGGVTEAQYVYNSTIYNIEDGASPNVPEGIAANVESDVRVSNTISFTVAGTAFSGTMSGSHNVSSDATAPGIRATIDQTDYASYFRNTAVGSEDLHLRMDASALWGTYGADLRSDMDLAVPLDLDNALRGPDVDMGADQFAP
jgi:hypothetical protein